MSEAPPTPPRGTIAQWVVWAIIAAALVAVAIVIIKAMGIVIPPFMITVAWILVAAIVGILAIKLLMHIAKL